MKLIVTAHTHIDIDLKIPATPGASFVDTKMQYLQALDAAKEEARDLCKRALPAGWWLGSVQTTDEVMRER